MRKGRLPKLSRDWYRGYAFVHWTLTIEDRATGWLTPEFHHHWRHLFLHACARYHLASPTYMLMPDHLHVFWLGLAPQADQSVAMEFLRKHLRPLLAPADWQRQPFDHVLTEEERERQAFLSVAGYVLDNPVRAGLVRLRADWPYGGACVPGYPALDVHRSGYWELFWRIYNKLVDRT